MKRNLILLLLCTFYVHTLLFSAIQLVEIQPSDNKKLDNHLFVSEDIAYIVVSESIAKSYAKNIETYIGNHQYLINIPKEKVNSIASKIYYVQPESKVFDDIDKTATIQNIQVQFASTIKKVNAIEILKSLNVSLYDFIEDDHIYKLQITTSKIAELAQLPFVLLISKDYKDKQLLVSDSYIMDRLPSVNMPISKGGLNLNGENMNIGIWDGGAIGTHINLEDTRVFNIDKTLSFSPYNVHPTQVAGAAAMCGNTSYLHSGAASKSNIYAWDNWGNIIQEIKDGISKYQLNVTNHSYNFEQSHCKSASGLYTLDASKMDKLAYEYPNVLHVVASGNTAHLCAINDTFYSLDIGYQGTKNAITVGYLYRNEKLVETSGRGPTTDGRLKPELVAKGFAYTASAPGTAFSTVYGSSFSAPQIAGIATLVQQKYKLQNGVLPPSSLVKAVLCNTAEDMYRKGLDYGAGFGRPDAKKAVQNIIDNKFIIGNISNQNQNNHQFTLTQNADFVSITLCWTDPAAYPLQHKILVNNVDLKLITPNNDTILPWVLNPIFYQNPAQRGIDNLNNIEYVTLDSALAGTYTILVNGTDIVTDQQQYSISYTFENNGIDIVYPDGGETLDAGANFNVTWNTRNVEDSLSFYYSIDSGINWTFIKNVHSRDAFFTWTTPNINTKNALIKAINSQFSDSSNATFNINFRPNANFITIAPCDKSANIKWPAIPNVQYYTIYVFDDFVWRKVDTTSKLSYQLTGLVNGKSYVVEMTATVDGVESNKSTAKIFTPSFTACSQLNDIGVLTVINPMGGRMHTSSQLGNQVKPVFVIKNYGSNPISNFNLSYQVNEGTIYTSTISRTINSNDTIQVQASNDYDMSLAGNYNLKAYSSFSLDTLPNNDTLVYTLKHLANEPISLPWTESFENSGATYSTNVFGIDGMEYADFNTDKYGRWRIRDNMYALSGKRALTLDNYSNTGSIKSSHIITLNLANYIDSIIYLDLSFMQHGETATDNIVYARGNDTATWIPILNLFQNKAPKGEYNRVQAINLFKLLYVDNGQTVSSSFQIKLATTNTKASIELTKSGGYTFDDIKFYVANNDLANSTEAKDSILCLNETKNIPIKIKIINQSNHARSNLKVTYIVDNANVVSETISDIILPYQTFDYTFNQTLAITQSGKYVVHVIADDVDDKYKGNDTSDAISFIANLYIDSLPYLNNFEQTSLCIPEGQNSSWAWSTPNKTYTKMAAQGNKAWTNSTFDTYNYSENSSLYLGCYNMQSLKNTPSVAFNHLLDIENLYDSAWAEYSIDGNEWNRIGCANCGTNFYGNMNGAAKWDKTLMPWQVASSKINIDTTLNNQHVFIRVRLQSDEGIVGEGLAIDDWHVYVTNYTIPLNDSVFIDTISNGNGWIPILKDDKIIAEIYDDNKVLGNITVGYFASNQVRKYQGKALLPRNWSINTENQVDGNFKIRLYLTNEEYLMLLNTDSQLFSMRDIAALRYNGFNQDVVFENNYIKGDFVSIPTDSLYFVPFENGYYVEMNTQKFGEFYLTSKAINPTFVPITQIVTLDADQMGDDAILAWNTTGDTNVLKYNIQYSIDGQHFQEIASIYSLHNISDTSDYYFIHNSNAAIGTVLYYRIEAVLNSGVSIQSLVDSIQFENMTGIKKNVLQIKSYFSQNQLHIEHNNSIIGNYNLVLVQLDGRVVFQKNIQIDSNKNSIDIPIQLLSNNIYILGLQNKNKIYYSKLYKN